MQPKAECVGHMPQRVLGKGQKAAYGAISTGEAIVSFSVNTYLLFFFSDVLGADPARVGLALAIGKFWDAVSDPLMGYISDRTRSPWGRRRPYIFSGGILLAITVWLMWSPPAWVTPQNSFYYLLVFYLAYSTFYTILMVPYAALGAELTPYYDERTELFTTAGILGAAGGLAAALLFPTVLAKYTGGSRQGFALIGVITALVLLPMVAATFLGARERFSAPSSSAPGGLLRCCRETLGNRPFTILFAVFLVAAIGIIIVISTLAFLAKYWLADEGAVGRILAVTMATTLAGTPLMGRLGKMTDKKTAYLIALGSMAACLAASFLMLRPGHPMLAMLWAAWLGLCNAGMLMLPRAILPDIIDEDELRSGQRREGVYSGMLTFAVKVSAALGIYLAGLGLRTAGFSAAAAESARQVTVLRVFFGPVPGLLLLLCLIIFLFFPLSRVRADAVRTELEQRRAQPTHVNETGAIHHA
jgi:sugar (glycoside-pentoside-hexuronide) transporter